MKHSEDRTRQYAEALAYNIQNENTSPQTAPSFVYTISRTAFVRKFH